MCFQIKKKILAEDSDHVLGPAKKHLPDINVILGTTLKGDVMIPVSSTRKLKSELANSLVI